jgi:hypothetical protein
MIWARPGDRGDIELQIYNVSKLGDIPSRMRGGGRGVKKSEI